MVFVPHSVLCTTRGIIQGSGVGPTFYIAIKSDLSTISPTNILSKYADDIDLRPSAVATRLQTCSHRIGGPTNMAATIN